MSLLAEGIRSSFEPCSLAILVPGLVIALLTRRTTRVPALGIFLGAAAATAWLPFHRLSTPFDDNIGGAAALAFGIWILTRRSELAWSAGAAGLIGAFAGATWIPCVGPEFGAVLNTGLRDPNSAILPMTVYLLGVVFPVLVLVAVIEFTPWLRARVELQQVRLAASLTGLLIAVIVLADQYPALMSELARRSSLG